MVIGFRAENRVSIDYSNSNSILDLERGVEQVSAAGNHKIATRKTLTGAWDGAIFQDVVKFCQ